MYSREETKKIKEKFWTTIGQYMSPIPSVTGEKVNWINYKTGIKSIFFKMDTTHKHAIIMIEITHPDESKRSLIFEQFKAFKSILENLLDEKWTWKDQYMDDYGRPSARIYTQIENINIFDEGHWPTLISFFKPRLVALDEFWSDTKDTFYIFT